MGRIGQLNCLRVQGIHDRPQCFGGCVANVSVLFCKRKGMCLTEVFYQGERISVPKEVAEFLKEDRKRQRAEAKRDERHLSKGDLEMVLSLKNPPLYPLDDLVLKNLRLENLRKAVACLEKPKRELLRLRYEEELSMAAIGELLGVSKMAISKQLKRVHKELRSSVW